MRIYSCQINTTIGDIEGNKERILAGISAAKKAGAQIVLFPELSLTGYPPRDLLLLPHFMDAVDRAVKEIATATYDITAIIGLPRPNRFKVGKWLHNSAAVMTDGRIIGYHDKLLLPTYDIFDERRYFEPGVRPWLWEIAGCQVAITICEDIWLHSGFLSYDRYTTDPMVELLMAPQRPVVLLNLSASPYSIAKAHRRMLVVQKVAKTFRCPVVLCNQVGAQDSMIFDGGSLIIAHNGSLLQRAQSFQEEEMFFDTETQLSKQHIAEPDVLHELFEALVLGLRDYCRKSNITTVCLGLSGGIDSAVVACIATAAMGKENVIGVSMPSRYSSKSSVVDAKALAHQLGIECKYIPIELPFKAYLQLLSSHFNDLPEDITEENIQSRVRGMILMALSNKFGHLVLATGNKSELAMGYYTLYGDTCGGISVIGDLSKRRVYALAHWINRHEIVIPQSILEKAPSAELKPNQRDSDTLPDYDYIDTVVEAYMEYCQVPEMIASQHNIELSIVQAIIRKIHATEYKRRQAPFVLRVTEKAFCAGNLFPIAHHWY